MISYTDIYDRFINLVDDPQLNRAYANNTIQFKKIAYNFLLNGLSNFTAPPQVCDLLAAQQDPEGSMEVFDGDGGKVYTITITIPDDADVVCYIAGKVDPEASIQDNKVTFSQDVATGTNCAVEYYSAGAFTADFGKAAGGMNKASMGKRVEEILARCMVIAWADKEQNFMLDIRNLLNDTDFKLHSPANSLKSKREWVNDLRFEIYTLQNKLNWDLRNVSTSYYGY